MRAITENHAKKVIDLMETLAAVEKRPPMTGAVRETAVKLKAALDAYAEDFGEAKAKQLERYARWQTPRGRH